MTDKTKKLTLASAQAMEARAMKLVASIDAVDSADDLEDAGYYVKWYTEKMVEGGYHPVAAEGFAARGRKAVAAAQVRLGIQRDAPGLPRSEGGVLDAGYFKTRFKSIIAVLSNYSSTELARECARLARRADPRVLQEDEFQ
ncbi:hypothetical protein LIS66_27105 (plasmid) [Pseudomonas sp. HN2]|uniref:hypothetical protein n=1 Tax=Pseudomonas sp. HN2 TaxID=2884805 RepID=UPI001D150C79|nr:hypothetical protein [Pseudomonas sp. HN2]UEB98643.1 hypothetical protein LIS66_27395 [Pseudomonas sp. HN2]UEB98700.1 hypothetical protein LIS66_27105 [Pseudomonas sp. HN2]